MIAFGIAVGSEERYRRFALPGIRRACGDKAIVIEKRRQRSIAEAYNGALAALSRRRDLEGAVLIHEDTEILDPQFCDKLRRVLTRPGVSVVGVAGARGVTSLAWWDGETFGRVRESRGLLDFGGGTHEVDAVDGLLLALSPWAIRNLRFDESVVSGFHGYDIDLCFEARSRGTKVMVTELDVLHHTRGGYGHIGEWLQADEAWRRKWGSARFAERARKEVSRARLRRATRRAAPA